jgi:copper chaperone CopZ
MNLRNKVLVAAMWVAAAVAPASAQLDRVVVQAVEGDIDCLPCAATIEMSLKKLAAVDKVAVSMSKQMVAITFKEGANFEPKAYRDAIYKAEVRVREFHLSMRGKVEKKDGKQYFVFGANRFLVAKSAKPLPEGVTVGVMALVDDSSQPYQITIDDVKPM